MDFGVSTACLYPDHTEDALRRIAEMGIKCVEIFINAEIELEPPVFSVISDMVRKFAIKPVSFHPFSMMEKFYMFNAQYDRRQEQAIDNYKRYFEKMSMLGSKIFVFHGETSEYPFERYLEIYSRLYRVGKEFGVTVAQENVARNLSKDIDFLRKMSECLGSECAFVLDNKQAIRSDADPFNIMEVLGDKICHFHISDNSDAGDCLLPGEGSFDFPRLMDRLKGQDYEGTLILEVYRDNFKEPEQLKDTVEFLKRL